jgi:hypothetical protein
MMHDTTSGMTISNLPLLLKRTLALWPYTIIALSLAGFVYMLASPNVLSTLAEAHHYSE